MGFDQIFIVVSNVKNSLETDSIENLKIIQEGVRMNQMIDEDGLNYFQQKGSKERDKEWRF